MDIAGNEAQPFLIDSNEALEFKLVRKPEDLEDDDCTFKPEMSHQVFGEKESIFGYRDLRIKLYYTAARLVTYLGVDYKEKADPRNFDGVKSDDIIPTIAPKLQRGFLTNLDSFIAALDKEDKFTPYGELKHCFKASSDEDSSDRTFVVYYCDGKDREFLKYHKRLETFILWYIDASSFIDTDDENWRYFVCYEKYKKDGKTMYAVVGYATVYQYYAYPKNIRPRISQMLVLPPFQRRGIGANLLRTIYNHYITIEEVLDITVEDPSAEFQHLRDFVDCENLITLPSFKTAKLKEGFTTQMVDEARSKFKVNKKQVRRIYEILRLKETNCSDKEEYRQYRLAIKKRLNTPFQKEQLMLHKLHKMQGFFAEDEIKAMSTIVNQEQRLENLDRQFQDIESDYRHVIDRLARR